MVPTARALALRAPLQEALRLLENVVRDPEAFDASTAERTFTVAANDNVMTMFGVELVRAMAAQRGDGLRISFREPDLDGIVGRMERGECDLLLAAAQAIPAALKAAPLSSERYMLAQRQRHPRNWISSRCRLNCRSSPSRWPGIRAASTTPAIAGCASSLNR
ncbi:MAG TPA: hypothetical protein VN089_10900 [Duganella sp.]|nr:hypothetical protein [Duganella sp.]